MAKFEDDDEKELKPKRRKKDKEEKTSFFETISLEIKKSISAILLIGVGVVLILASLKQAGPAGEFLYANLDKFFGWGYYLLPFVAFTVAVVFLLSREVKLLSPTFIGSFVLIISSLSFIDIVFPGEAGLMGNALGMIKQPFGFPASLVMVVSLIIIGGVITLNIPLKISLPVRNKKEEENKSPEDKITIKDPTSSLSGLASERAEQSALGQKIADVLSKAKPKEEGLDLTFHAKDFKLPPLTLLKTNVEKPQSGDLKANAFIIKRTLESFGIPCEMGEISIGPKVTRYTLKPAEGVRLNKITNLNQDLALALALHPIRIEAPIPGKSAVGIEVPNKTPAMVRLGNLISLPEFNKGGLLSFILGRDVNGDPITANIEKMPHLLISGATGSGKSILVHSIITSLLYKNSPRTLRLLMIDPKRVELTAYKEIPHLASPVIVEGKKAVNVFKWAVHEMDERYNILMNAKVRDIKSYNEKNKDEPMPYVVMVVDELADLMASYGREVEGYIVRLAQMARAVGIHLILATQRPSVEVITGLIKANIPTRIALQVASQIDSRTIIDMAGAEKLLGGGDMLFLSNEFSKPKRIQSPYISEEEINAVANYIRENNETNFDALSPIKDMPDAKTVITKDSIQDFMEGDAGDEDDDLYSEAVEVVKQAQKASASLLQRRLKVGYARAARLLDIMEQKNVIGPGDGAKAREVYITNDTGIPPIEDEDSEEEA